VLYLQLHKYQQFVSDFRASDHPRLSKSFLLEQVEDAILIVEVVLRKHYDEERRHTFVGN